MTTRTVSNEIARIDNTPKGLIEKYRNDFAAVLPSHVKASTWVRLAQGALKRGKRVEAGPFKGWFELEVAANNNPGVFMATLLDAARLGLEPGTEEYYLTPRKVKGQLEILGIVGYQGYIELMYRAGAVDSIVAEVVYTKDTFSYRPGIDEVPVHEIDWDADTRGDLRLVYAYARMKGGATSKVVVLNRAAIKSIRAKSQGANSEYSPWNTHEDAMWLKSAVRQLRKWVPTSAEYRREQMRAAIEARTAADRLGAPTPGNDDEPATDPDEGVDPDNDEVVDAEFVDGELGTDQS